MFFPVQLISFVSISLASLAVVAQEPNCARNYTVNLGDTCDGISAAQNVSTFQLAQVNADKIDAACDNLAVGESLCLGIIGQDCTTVHVVETGDTCAVITEETGVDLTTLLANNPNVNDVCSNIYIGEVLCTADQVVVS